MYIERYTNQTQYETVHMYTLPVGSFSCKCTDGFWNRTEYIDKYGATPPGSASLICFDKNEWYVCMYVCGVCMYVCMYEIGKYRAKPSTRAGLICFDKNGMYACMHVCLWCICMYALVNMDQCLPVSVVLICFNKNEWYVCMHVCV